MKNRIVYDAFSGKEIMPPEYKKLVKDIVDSVNDCNYITIIRHGGRRVGLTAAINEAIRLLEGQGKKVTIIRTNEKK